MKAKFYGGPNDGGEGTVQTSKGFAPELYQYPQSNIDPISMKNPEDLIGSEIRVRIAYYDLQEVKDNIAYYKYRCIA